MSILIIIKDNKLIIITSIDIGTIIVIVITVLIIICLIMTICSPPVH